MSRMQIRLAEEQAGRLRKLGERAMLGRVKGDPGLVDCLSFEVTRHYGIEHALAFD